MTPDRIAPRPDTGRPEVALFGWVYVATTAHGVKIGITLTPDVRRGQIERAGGHRVLRWVQRWAYNPGGCERHLHESWAEYRQAGEWFSVHIGPEVEDYLISRTAAGPSTGFSEVAPTDALGRLRRMFEARRLAA
jgi:hypothetical protein